MSTTRPLQVLLLAAARRRAAGFAAIVCVIVLASPRHAAADPVKVTPVAVTASNSYPGHPPSDAVDGQSGTSWNAGSGTTQWIQLDLGRPVSLAKIRLQLEQNPDGNSVHVVSVGPDPEHLTNVYVWNAYTRNGEWLEASGDVGAYKGGNVRYVRVTTTKTPSWVAWREIEVYQGVEYFGYYCDACQTSGGDFIAETTAAGSNLVFIGSADLSDLATKLAEAKQRGVKAIVDVENLLFIPLNGTELDQTSPDHWLTTWSSIAAIVNGGYLDTVAAFYLHDEPYSANWGPDRQPVSVTTMTTLATQLKHDFPAIPVASIMDFYTARTTDAAHIAMLDWTGFDCYGTWSEGCYGVKIPDINAHFRPLLSRQQRLMAVPHAWRAPGEAEGAARQETVIKENIDLWHQEVLSDAKYIAVLPFIWQSSPGQGVPTGAREIPWYRERLYQLASSLLPRGGGQLFPTSYSASSYIEGDRAFGAFDRDPSSDWNAGGGPTQWIQANLGTSTHVSRIDFTVSQFPAGRTLHYLDALTPAGWIQLRSFYGDTSDGDVLTWTGSADITAFRITTAQSPSWVSWRDIAFYE